MATTKLKGNEVNLAGNEVNVGDKAPEVTVVNSDGLADKVVGGAQGKKQLIVVVPSLDTPVCATETRQFNAKAAELDNVDVTVGLGPVLSDQPLWLAYPTTVNNCTSSAAIFSLLG